MATIPYDYYVSVSEDNNTSERINNNEIQIWNQWTTQMPEETVAFDEAVARATEEMRDSIDLRILQDIIMGVQPMQDIIGEVFHMNIKYACNKREKLDLRLPDKLFEME